MSSQISLLFFKFFYWKYNLKMKIVKKINNDNFKMTNFWILREICHVQEWDSFCMRPDHTVYTVTPAEHIHI